MSTEYVPATYSNTLDQMLARGAKPGQGGHLEATPAEASLALVRLQASCWSSLASEIAQVYGLEGAEPIIREIVRRAGRYRGNEIRRNVEKRGLPLDVPHLLDYWDYATDEAVDLTEYDREPEYYAHEVPGCGFWDQMMEVCPQPLAIAMCEEIHVAVAKEYNPAMDVWYPALLSRGQARCIFRWEMPHKAAEKAAKRAHHATKAAKKAGQPLAGERGPQKPNAARSYSAIARLHVVFYHYAADQLLRTVGEDTTDDILRRAMRKWGSWRGQEMREDHQRRGWPFNLESFITYLDDPAAGDAWVAENVKLTPTEHSKDITESAYSEWFDKLATGRFALPLFEEALPAQVQAYNPAMEMSIPLLMERGDSKSRFVYTIRS
jgi:hypothetical protein